MLASENAHLYVFATAKKQNSFNLVLLSRENGVDNGQYYCGPFTIDQNENSRLHQQKWPNIAGETDIDHRKGHDVCRRYPLRAAQQQTAENHSRKNWWISSLLQARPGRKIVPLVYPPSHERTRSLQSLERKTLYQQCRPRASHSSSDEELGRLCCPVTAR